MRATLAAIMLLCFGLALPVWAEVTDFSFVQITDTHFPSPNDDSENLLPTLASLGEIPMPSYHTVAPRPSFIISTGDTTDFSVKNGNAWANYLSAFSELTIPLYIESGNHEGSFSPIQPELRQLYGAPYYSFTTHGCHFIALDSGGMLPRPNFSIEELRWLRADLEKTGPDMPVFIFFHHPLGGEGARYEWDRLSDMLRHYNVAVLMVGHWHSAFHTIADGFDEVGGGVTFRKRENVPGYMVYSVQNGVLHVAYAKTDAKEAAIPIMEKTIASHAAPYPTIHILQPTATPLRGQDAAPAVTITAKIDQAPATITSATYEIDSAPGGTLKLHDGQWIGQYVDAARKLQPGAHYLRITFTDAQNASYHQSTHFAVEYGAAAARWRTALPGSFRGRPTVADNQVYVGCTDNSLYALDTKSGAIRWHFPVAGAVAGAPAIANHHVIFGVYDTDGDVYALNRHGKMLWHYQAGTPVYAGVVIANDLVIITTRSGAVHAVDLATGKRRWISPFAAYESIQSSPVVSNGQIFFGSWDSYVHALNLADGLPQWKTISAGAATLPDISIFLAPALTSPVVIGDRVYMTDRDYYLTIFSAKTGTILSSIEGYTAACASSDNQSLFLRKTNGDLVKADLDGKVLWSVYADLKIVDVIPAPPIEEHGVVYTCSDMGLVSAFSTTDGAQRWQYQATPQMFVSAPFTVTDGVVYVAGSDGVVTAIAAVRR